MSETFSTTTTGHAWMVIMTQSASPDRDIQNLSNVGPAVRRYFERVGITRVERLAGRDPLELYEEMCAADGQAHDLCLLDAVMSAVDQAGRQPARPWWHSRPSASD